MGLIQIKHVVRRLSLAKLRKLDEWLHEMIRKAEAEEHARRASSRERTAPGKTPGDTSYRQESVRCGKENCKCASGKLHGPYWYSYTRVKDKVTSQYVGKKLPWDVEKKLRSRTER
jgi:hypothetical protein